MNERTNRWKECWLYLTHRYGLNRVFIHPIHDDGGRGRGTKMKGGMKGGPKGTMMKFPQKSLHSVRSLACVVGLIVCGRFSFISIDLLFRISLDFFFFSLPSSDFFSFLSLDLVSLALLPQCDTVGQFPLFFCWPCYIQHT